MIYLEYTALHQGQAHSHAVELSVSSIAEAARLFMAFEEACTRFCATKVEMTSVGTAKRRGVTYERWSGL